MRKGKGLSQPGGIIIVRQMEKHHWVFKLPRITELVDDRLENGMEWMGAKPKRAEAIFRELIREYPEHIDAYHHLALTLEMLGKSDEAFAIWQRTVKLALQFFPAHFSMKRDHLAWGFVENRPFLRLYFSFGLQLRRRGQIAEALGVFENLLVLNPQDNQGARGWVVECHFALKDPQGVLSLCGKYPHDAMEQVLYGKALALFQLGKLKPAGRAVRLAAECFPLIAAELLKPVHQKPKFLDEQSVTLGTPEQAYLYWKEQGKYWRETPGAEEFLRTHLPED